MIRQLEYEQRLQILCSPKQLERRVHGLWCFQKGYRQGAYDSLRFFFRCVCWQHNLLIVILFLFLELLAAWSCIIILISILATLLVLAVVKEKPLGSRKINISCIFEYNVGNASLNVMQNIATGINRLIYWYRSVAIIVLFFRSKDKCIN